MALYQSFVRQPETWCKQKGKEVVLADLAPKSAEYKTVLNKINGNVRNYVTGIARIQNRYLYGRYLLRKEEYIKNAKNWRKKVEERTLLHATGSQNVDSVARNNLDWRLVKRHKFGKGVSFSTDAGYANKEGCRNVGKHRAMIICKVLIWRCQPGNKDTVLPGFNFDTTVDTHKKVYVKYYDDEYYPEYVAYYNKPKPKKQVARRAQNNVDSLTSAMRNLSLNQSYEFDSDDEYSDDNSYVYSYSDSYDDSDYYYDDYGYYL